MKKLTLLFIIAFGFVMQVWGQQDSLFVVLNERENNITQSSRNIDTLKKELSQLIREELKSKDSTIIKTVQRIDSIQKLIEQREQEIYTYNFIAALQQLKRINRLKMTLGLYESTKSFHQHLNQATNPLQYSEYNTWRVNFEQYITAEKHKNYILDILDGFLNKDSTVTGAVIANIPYMNLLSEGISLFNKAKKRNKDLVRQSNRILVLNIKLSGLSQEINAVNNDKALELILANFDQLYSTVLNTNLSLIGETESGFLEDKQAEVKNREYDAIIEKKASKYIEEIKKDNPDNWKSDISQKLSLVQRVDTEFRNVVLKTRNDLKEYGKIIERYQNDPDLNPHLADSKQDLDKVLKSFEDIFPAHSHIFAENIYKTL